MVETSHPSDLPGADPLRWTCYIGIEPKTRRSPSQVRFECIDAPSEAAALDAARKLARQQGCTIRDEDHGDFKSTWATLNDGRDTNNRRSVYLLTWAEELGIKVPTEGNGYCVSHGSAIAHQRKTGAKVPTYTDWERNVGTPLLKEHGFNPEWCWVDGEADSFGPLSRKIHVTKNGIHYDFWYG